MSSYGEDSEVKCLNQLQNLGPESPSPGPVLLHYIDSHVYCFISKWLSHRRRKEAKSKSVSFLISEKNLYPSITICCDDICFN